MSQLEAVSSSMNTNVGSLVCGRCRRKTGEVVSKLCHACGAPLHPSCGDDAAAHECGLTFGFPAPTAFCSKRCYDMDALAHNKAKRLPHVPNEVTAALTVKIGDVSKTSRKHVSVSTFQFLLSEGFEVFRAKANSCTARELQQHAAAATASYVRDDRAVYIRPGVHSKQAELVELSEKNFEARIARTYRNFLKRKPTSSNSSNCVFECDIFTYVRKDGVRRKPSASGIKGTSRMHTFMAIADQAAGDQGVLAQAPSSSGDHTGDGPVVSVSSSHKRKHAQLAEPTTSASSASTSAPSLLNPQSELPAFLDLNQDPTYKTVRMLLNGQVVPVKVNVRDLLACFGMVHAVAGDDSGTSNTSTNSSMQDL